MGQSLKLSPNRNQYFVCQWIDMKYFLILVLISRTRSNRTRKMKESLIAVQIFMCLLFFRTVVFYNISQNLFFFLSFSFRVEISFLTE